MSSENVPGSIPPENGPSDSCPSPTAETVTPEQIAELRTAASRGVEAQDRYVRLYADFENYKKRSQRERDDARRAAIEGAISRMLPAVDNFEMAMAAAQQPGTTIETLVAGVAMIQNQLRGILEEMGVEEIIAVGQAFDPSIHEAVSQQESADVPEGHVLIQIRKGYRCRDRLLRPATVIVSKAPASDEGNGSAR